MTKQALKEVKSYAIGLAVIAIIILSVAVISSALHKKKDLNCLSVAQARNNIGKTDCVSFTVGYTYVSSEGNSFIDEYRNYSSGFEVWIPSSYSFGPGLTNKYANKTIDVSGTITSYYGAPQIEVTNPSQITLAQ
ncbi:MAG TPA: hypothetical protein VGS08_01015 [Candidatus Saccharimonadales bacterium]|nr:hypothetical protein [Candidatus Saccharimonadales bacterium]